MCNNKCGNNLHNYNYDNNPVLQCTSQPMQFDEIVSKWREWKNIKCICFENLNIANRTVIAFHKSGCPIGNNYLSTDIGEFLNWITKDNPTPDKKEGT